MNASLNPLNDVLTPAARKIVYAVFSILAFAFAAWQASQGDWSLFIGGMLTSLTNATAASNVTVKPVDPNYERRGRDHVNGIGKAGEATPDAGTPRPSDIDGHSPKYEHPGPE